MTQANIDSLERTYDQWYSESPHWEEAPGKSVLVDGLTKCLDKGAPLRGLDIGCGTGSFLSRIQSEVSSQWELWGMDVSPVAIDLARERHPGFSFRCGDATETGLPSSSFDFVTCYGSWEHFPDPGKAIREASRLLAPGGWFFAMMPTLGVHRTDREDEGWYEDLPVEGCDRCQLQWNFTRDTWSELFSASGLQLAADDLSTECGAQKAGVFYFGVKLAHQMEMDEPERGLADLGFLARRLAAPLGAKIRSAAELIRNSLDQGGKILACGNGGSAADVQHFVAEFVGRMTREREALPAISLTTDPSIVTALGNDYGFENVFARQIEALARSGDVLVAISTSGQSPNVLRAIEVAQKRGVSTVALIGARGNPIVDGCDVTIGISDKSTARVQELHTAALHAICEHVDTIGPPVPANTP